MNVLKALEAIETAPRGNARLEAIKTNDSPELREFFNLALSPQITFGMKKLPKPIPAQVAILRNEKHWFEELKSMLKQMEERTLTGNAADQYVGSFLGICDEIQRKWSERVIRQDLRLNIGAKDVNKALDEEVVYIFEVPLAKSYEDVKTYTGKYIIQPKFDGARCVAYLGANGGKVTLFSRTGKEWGNFESVRLKLEEVNKLRRFQRNKDVVLDGEVVSFVDDKINFQAIQANLFSSGEETGKLKYFVFDIAERKEWESQASTPYKTRFENAKTFVRDAIDEVSGACFKLGIVDGFSVENPTKENLEEYCTTFTDKGFEGAMARKEDSPIKRKRISELLKIKTFLDAEAEIIGFAPGQGKALNTMGALICKTDEGVVFEIGTGFSDEQRKKFYKDDSLIGQFASYKYKHLTNDRVPFHNSFRGIRAKADLLEKSK